MNCDWEISRRNVICQFADFEAKAFYVSNSPTHLSSFINFNVSIVYILRVIKFHSQHFANSYRCCTRLSSQSFIIDAYRCSCQINSTIILKRQIVCSCKSVSFLQSISYRISLISKVCIVGSIIFVCFTFVSRYSNFP